MLTSCIYVLEVSILTSCIYVLEVSILTSCICVRGIYFASVSANLRLDFRTVTIVLYFLFVLS